MNLLATLTLLLSTLAIHEDPRKPVFEVTMKQSVQARGQIGRAHV